MYLIFACLDSYWRVVQVENNRLSFNSRTKNQIEGRALFLAPISPRLKMTHKDIGQNRA